MSRGQTTVSGARSARWLRHLVALVLQLALVGAAVGGAYEVAFNKAIERELGLREFVPSAAATLASLHPRPGLIVISLHNIEKKPHTSYAITPGQFSGLLQDLTAAGFHPAGLKDVLDVIAGKKLSQPKALITFDDGTKGLWTYADKALAAYKWRAMAFVITGRVGSHQPYYLTWPELKEMQANGRWDLESHTYLGHDRVASSPYGDKGPFLSTVQWVDSRKEFESIDDWQAAVDADLTRSQSDFLDHGLPRPQLFAYPFSARGLPSNDPRVPHLLVQIVLRHFAATFTNDIAAGYVDPTQVRHRLLYRIELDGSMTRSAVYARLLRAVRGPRAPDPEEHLDRVKSRTYLRLKHHREAAHAA